VRTIFILAIAFAVQAASDSLPDPNLTPGDTMHIDPATFCNPGYTKLVRDVPQSLKDSVYKRYGITEHVTGQMEIDHLIPLCAGGSNSIKNLWPESYLTQPWNAHKKDVLELRLRRLICTGHISVLEAQQAIAKNWIEVYKKYVEEPKRKNKLKTAQENSILPVDQ
jgi:hypothetical protein